LITAGLEAWSTASSSSRWWPIDEVRRPSPAAFILMQVLPVYCPTGAKLKAQATGSAVTWAFSGGRTRCRSADLTLFRRALYQLSYPTADLTGFEPASSGLTGRRALQTAPQVLACCSAHGLCPQGLKGHGSAVSTRRTSGWDLPGHRTPAPGLLGSRAPVGVRSDSASPPVWTCLAASGTGSGRT
jgi:hypothetical protein